MPLYVPPAGPSGSVATETARAETAEATKATSAALTTETSRAETAEAAGITTAEGASVPLSSVGAASGVAALDTNARLLIKQAPHPTGLWMPSDWGRNGGWMTARAAAASRLVNVGCFGTSVEQGFFSSNWRTKGYIGKLITDLQTTYGDGGAGFFSGRSVQGLYAGMPADVVASGSGGNAAGGFDGSAIGLNTWTLYPHTAGSGVTLTFSNVRGTSVEVVLYPELSGTHTVNWTIDGVAQTAINAVGTAAGGFIFTTVSGLSAGNHTVVLTMTAGQPYVQGVYGKNATGILGHNMSSLGRTSADVLTTTALTKAGQTNSGQASIQNLALDLFILAGMGLNDTVLGTPTAPTPAPTTLATENMVSNCATALDYALAGNSACSLVIVAGHLGSTTDTDEVYPQYVRELRALAETYGAMFVNLWAMGNNNWTTLNALSYWGDGTADGLAGTNSVHYSDAGHAWAEGKILPYLTAA